MRGLSRQFGNGIKRVGSWLRCSTIATTVLLLVQAAMAAVPSSTAHVTTADVLTAMVKQHLPVENVQVDFPAGIAATVEAPVLEVGQLVMRDAQSANLRMDCVKHAECPAFYVVVRWPLPPGKLSAGIANPASHAAANPPTQTLRAGSHATLLIDQQKVHIRMPVICTQNGAVGDRIRVITTNRQQTYEAVVLTDTELQGSL